MPAYNARCVYRSTLGAGGVLIVNTFHLEVDTLSSPPNWTSVATDVDTWLTTLYRAMCGTNMTIQDLTVTDETYPGSTLGQGLHNIALAGTRTVADSDLGFGLCQVVSLKSAVTKRYARGRMFLPPAQASATAAGSGLWATGNAYWTAATAFFNALLAGHTAGSTTYSPIIFSKSQLNKSLTPYTFTVTAYTQNPHQLYLRSRET